MIERHTSLQAEHILPPARFDAERTALQAELRAHKQHRRIDVGPFAVRILGASFLVKIFILSFRNCRGPNYQNIINIPKSIWGSKYQNIGCIDSEFND